MARCMMIQADLPQSLWAEAINAATYFGNRCPTKALNYKTPLETWSNRKPYVGLLRIIGSKAYVLNKRGKCSKFEPKGDEFVLVSYDNISKAYRLWKKNTKTVIRARDVKFIEKVEPNKEKIKHEAIMPLNMEEVEERFAEINAEEDDTPQLKEDDPPQPEGTSVKRGRSRSKLIRTGKRGRPSKMYQSERILSETEEDPINVEEAMSRGDSDL